MKRVIKATAMALVLMLLLTNVTVFAESYVLDYDGNALNSPSIYNHENTLTGANLGIGDFVDPSDLFIDNTDRLFLLDKGNNRLIILDQQYNIIKILSKFYLDGEETTLLGPTGVFYSEPQDRIYISDTENNRILVSDFNGNVDRVVYIPDSELLNKDLLFKPTKIIVDNLGIIYVISQNVNTGAITIRTDGSFGGFYGINAIKQTSEVIAEFFWRKVFSFAKYNASDSFQPTQLSNLFWNNSERCIYATSPPADEASSPVSKLNANGDNLLNKSVFGETNEEGSNPSTFVDITVDSLGVISVLDGSNCKIYQYTASGDLIGVFGGKGYKTSLFSAPSSIVCNSKKQLIVLDAGKSTLVIFEQTDYGKNLQQALSSYNNGLYAESITQWEDVLRSNFNYIAAYSAMGKAYVELGEYKSAMKYFKIARDKNNYSIAKGYIYNNWLRKNFSTVAIGVILLFIFIYMYEYWKKLFYKIRNKIKGENRIENK